MSGWQALNSMDLLDATVHECCGDSTISIDLTLRFWQSRAYETTVD